MIARARGRHRRRPARPLPRHRILAEEGGERPGDRDAPLWIIDPLDGTTNFAHGLPLFSVSIACVVGGSARVGVVYAPALGFRFAAVRGGGATCNGRPIGVSQTAALDSALLTTGFPYDRRTSPENNLAQFVSLKKRARGIRRLGSAALDLSLVAAGKFDGYWEMKLKPWDIAAGLLLCEEAGGQISNWSGGPSDLFRGEVLATNRHIHHRCWPCWPRSRRRCEYRPVGITASASSDSATRGPGPPASPPASAGVRRGAGRAVGDHPQHHRPADAGHAGPAVGSVEGECVVVGLLRLSRAARRGHWAGLLSVASCNLLFGWVYGVRTGLPLALCTYLIGAIIGFVISSHTSHDRVDALIEEHDEARRSDDARCCVAVGTDAGSGDAVALSAGFPFPFSNLLLTCCGVRLAPYLLATFLGLLPCVAVATFVASTAAATGARDIQDLVRRSQHPVFLVFGALLGLGCSCSSPRWPAPPHRATAEPADKPGSATDRSDGK